MTWKYNFAVDVAWSITIVRIGFRIGSMVWTGSGAQFNTSSKPRSRSSNDSRRKKDSVRPRHYCRYFLYCLCHSDRRLMVKITRRFVLDFIAMGGAMAGSILVASNSGNAVLGYSMFLASAIASAILLKITNGPKSLYLTNLYFVVVNIIGIIQFSK